MNIYMSMSTYGTNIRYCKNFKFLECYFYCVWVLPLDNYYFQASMFICTFFFLSYTYYNNIITDYLIFISNETYEKKIELSVQSQEIFPVNYFNLYCVLGVC